MRLIQGLTSVALALSALACGESEPPRLPPTPARNVVFVLVDTLRADHTTLGGYHRSTTPFLESFAAEGVVFERGRSQAGCTYPSMNSMLTSRYPFDFYRRGPGTMGIPEEVPSIAEILKDHGYFTAAVSASPIVRATPSASNPAAGFGRGFDVFDESCLWQAAECVNQRAEEILEDIDEPFFLYLHYMDPHDPYQPPAGRRRFSGPYEGFDFIAAGDANPIAEMLYDDGPVIDLDDADIEHLVDLYDDEISYFDGMLGELVGHLRDVGFLDESMFILTADHGEEFLEHGHVKHCRGVWNSLTHVPVVIRAPGLAPGLRIDTAVQALDLVPTILDYLRLDGSSAGLEGRSLLPLVSGTTSGERYAYSDQIGFRSIDDGRFHLILDGLQWTFKLYDTESDPLEQHDLVHVEPGRAGDLDARLKAWLEDTGQWEHFDMTLRAAEKQHEQLRALGYLE